MPKTHPVWTCGLSKRAANCLLRAGYACLADVLSATENDLFKQPGIGRITLNEILRWRASEERRYADSFVQDVRTEEERLGAHLLGVLVVPQ